jgi:flagellar biosynthesis protein FlhB
MSSNSITPLCRRTKSSPLNFIVEAFKLLLLIIMHLLLNFIFVALCDYIIRNTLFFSLIITVLFS